MPKFCSTCGNHFQASTKYPELQKVVDDVVDTTIKLINNSVKQVKSDMPYKAQWVLEEVAKALKARV